MLLLQAVSKEIRILKQLMMLKKNLHLALVVKKVKARLRLSPRLEHLEVFGSVLKISLALSST